MKKLNKIKILGKEYQVIYVPKVEEVKTMIGGPDIAYGQITYTDSTIRLFDGYRDKFDLVQATLHEVMHGIIVALDVELDEKSLDLIAMGVANVLIDNKLLA